MGTIRIGPIVLMISMMALGLFVVMTILTGTGNVLGATYRFIWIPALILGCVAPRAAMYVLLIFATFLDIPKKFLVTANVLHMDFRDVYFILAVPPVMLLGMVTHYLACFALRVRQMTRRNTILFVIATLLVTTTAMIALVKGGFGMQALKPLANTSAYYGLIFVLPLALPGVVDVQKFFRFALIIMIPAALHALWHFWFGLFDFEHQYMESGFSINLKYLLWGEGIFGPFSAQGPLSTSMAICASICLSPLFFRGQVPREYRIFPTVIMLLLFVLFATTAILSLKRGPLLIIPGVMFGLVVLRSGLLTIATYGVATTIIVVLVVSGEDIAYELAAWQNWLYDLFGTSGAKEDLLRVRTFHVRLMDFNMLADGNNWTPFGAEIAQGEGGYRAHALLVRLIMQNGYVPVGTIFAILVPSVFFLHRRLIRMSKGKSFDVFLLRLVASLAFSVLGASILGVLSLEAYPNPFFFGVFLGVMAAGLTRERQSREEIAIIAEPEAEEPPVLGGVRQATQ